MARHSSLLCTAADSEDNGAITTEQHISEHTPGLDGGCLSQDNDRDADIVDGIWIISDKYAISNSCRW